MPKNKTNRSESPVKATREDLHWMSMTLAELSAKFSAPGAPEPSAEIRGWLETADKLAEVLALKEDNDRRERRLVEQRAAFERACAGLFTRPGQRGQA